MARVTAKAGEASGPDAAPQELAELALDERRDAAGRLGGAEERGEVRAYDAMEHGVFGGPRPIGVYACGGSAQTVAAAGG